MNTLIEVSVSPLVTSLLTGFQIDKVIPWVFCGFVVWIAFKHGKK